MHLSTDGAGIEQANINKRLGPNGTLFVETAEASSTEIVATCSSAMDGKPLQLFFSIADALYQLPRRILRKIVLHMTHFEIPSFASSSGEKPPA